MNASLRFVALAILVVTNAACSGGGKGNPDASTEGGPADSGKDSAKDTGSGMDAANNDAGNDGGGGPTVDPICTAPTTAPSNGSCIALMGDGGAGTVSCNPITNAPCNTGEACDLDTGGGYRCFAPPPANTATLCQTCDITNGPACVGTMHCITALTNAAECARFCCTDPDCGSGHCDKTTYNTTPVGVCVK
jgi:hypothetical protein